MEAELAKAKKSAKSAISEIPIARPRPFEVRTSKIHGKGAFATRNIKKGEELSYHYNTDGEGLIACRCHPGCQTLL